MKKTIRTAALLLLAMAVMVPALTVSASAGSAKSGKTGKEAPPAASISLAQAEEIALDHAGVDSADAVFTKEELDKAVYELKFSGPTAKYRYEISASDGSVLSCEMESDRPHGAPPYGGCPAYEAAVSPEQARQTALDDAGLDEEDLKYVVCYVSWADHAPYAYEVRFSTRTEHHHYTIGLDSGAVLESVCTPRRR